MSASSSAPRVLVLDGDMTPSLAVVRSLGRLGLRVDVASHEGRPLAGYSRYCRTKRAYPSPLTREAAFLDWCAATLDEGIYCLIIPVTERTAAPMRRLLDRADGARVAVAPPSALEVALDKDKTLALARELGIPAPRGLLVESLPAAAARAELRMPVVLKPARSIGANAAGRMQLSVEYALDERELLAKAEHFLRFGPVLLQEFVRGEGAGIELIARHGEIVFAFQHQRLHEVPLTGGGSCLRRSVPVEPELLEASRALMRALNWHGVAMVEFKWNPSCREFSLMEINGRFWGSLPLAIAAGADFPAMLYELLTQGDIAPRPPAKTGVYCRKLSSDLYWHEMVLRKDAPANLVRFPSLGSVLKDDLRVFSPRHHFDVQQWRDPLPGLVDIGRIARDYRERVARLFAERRARRAQIRAWRGGEVAAKLAQARGILFLCYGNINRSALAERYFLARAGAGAPRVVSAGFHEHDGRPADPVMVDVAAENGVDMRAWSSRLVDDAMLRDSDVVFVMELKHLQRLAEMYPDATRKVYLLGAAAGDIEIADPYGKAREVYAHCAQRIRASVDVVLDAINPAGNWKN